MIDYIRDAHDIYRQSFAIIRAEAKLEGIPDDLEALAVRVIHACGMPEVIEDLLFSPGAGAAGRAALEAGAPILCDSRMVSEGITRARLPGRQSGRLHPAGSERARAGPRARQHPHARRRWSCGARIWAARSWSSAMRPTALFRLLEMLDEGAPKPALILGFPVGFVGAAESKEALAADSRGVPFVTLRGRRGGSAMAAAAVNALGRDHS